MVVGTSGLIGPVAEASPPAQPEQFTLTLGPSKVAVYVCGPTLPPIEKFPLPSVTAVPTPEIATVMCPKGVFGVLPLQYVGISTSPCDLPEYASATWFWR